MLTLEEPKTCLKCKHTRTAGEEGPSYACPKCGGVYARLEAAARANGEAPHKGLAHVAYVLYVLPLGITTLAGVVLAYVLGSKSAGTWVASHCDWLTRTFWACLFWTFLLWAAGWMALGGTLLIASSRGGQAAAAGGMGMLMFFQVALAGLTIWYFYRVVKGWFYLFREDAIG